MSTPDPLSVSRPPLPSSIFALIHEIHATVTLSVDTSLTWEQLNSPPVNYTLVRPIVQRYGPQGVEKVKPAVAKGHLPVPERQRGGEAGQRNPMSSLGGVLYALMVNRVQYISLAASDLSYAPLQSSRAAFCELLAMKLLRSYPHPEVEAELVGELVGSWCPFDGACRSVWESMGTERKEVEETKGSALELAIVSSAKHFLSMPLLQHLVQEIYLGHLVYSPTTSRSLISDSYLSERTKTRRRASSTSRHRPEIARQGADGPPSRGEGALAEVYVYNPYEAGWLDHARLRVPKWRQWIEFSSFGILLVLFLFTLARRDLTRVTPIEGVFMIFTLGFILEEFAASQEHGWTVYALNAWNAFDMAYIVVFLLFLFLRMFALATRSVEASDLAFDILACGACILFPRLVFFLIKDNVVILALKAMIARFVSFMGLVIVAFSGICFCLWTLGRGTWTVKQIVWLMLQIWFGSSYLGFSSSESFHPIFGPIILIGYAALCNVLLITILISILSNTFAEINANAQSEHLFQRVVKTVEGVKSDAIFSFYPPINLLAVVVLVPLSWVCSPRELHRINVFAIRVTSFPVLIVISLWERHQFRKHQGAVHLRGAPLDLHLSESFLGGGSEMLVASVFEAGPPPIKSAADPFTPPRASSVNGAPEIVTPERNGIRSPPPTPRPFDSPLAKLFGIVGLSATERGETQEPSAPKEELEALQAEIKDVRASQLRMEDMLNKLLAGEAK